MQAIQPQAGSIGGYGGILKVVRILDEFRIIVNYGSNSGAKVGQKMMVIQSHETIYDPETHADLGNISINKAIIAIKEVYPLFCVCVNGEEQNPFLMSRRLNVDIGEISFGPPSTIQINVNKITQRKKNISSGIAPALRY
ncbi:MAG: hypothetical protein ABFC84_16500 [Veillonellales bacterium]